MKINSINSSHNFTGKEQYIKEFSGKLVNGNNAIFRTHLNRAGNPQTMECYAFNKHNNIVEGKAIGRNPKLRLDEIINFLNDIKKDFNDCDVFAKFADVMSH